MAHRVFAELKQLKELFDANCLTEVEYAEEKRLLLEKSRGGQDSKQDDDSAGDEPPPLVTDDSDSDSDSDSAIEEHAPEAEAHAPPAFVSPPTKRQSSLFSRGFTKTVGLSSGESIKITQEAQLGQVDGAMSGKYICKYAACKFSTNHPPALAHHVKRKHATEYEETRPYTQQSVCDVLSAAPATLSPRSIEGPRGADQEWRVKPLITVTSWGAIRVKLEMRAAKHIGGASNREGHSTLKKLRLVALCRQYKEEGRPFPGATVASIGDVDPSLITRWCASEPKLLQRLQSARAKAVLGKGRFPRVETQLFRDFQACRKKGLRIGRRWLRTKARVIAKKLYPGRYFRASEGWCTNWLRRNNLSYRKKTNKKTKSTEERLPKIIKRWHARLRLRLQTPEVRALLDLSPQSSLTYRLKET
ncbi:hypothetical protein CYMTET_9143 [Cymbomonas tetramitiformis]|uniref:HTH CENPB-type domain-containing protein n=1 Tax=Cymbomonas tetramitiformis TaxID=36881 RepID=A0AAE0GSB9_9CHLO|nr:hypothetical protein CYMTET_9143 [Cymbomonas tetramitiformis]